MLLRHWRIDSAMFRARDAFVGGLLASALIASACAQLLAAKSPEPTAASLPQTTAGAAEGKKLFESQCAACHGLDGHGGERAPDIATNPKTQNRTDEQLRQIVQRGLPGTGMPAFAALSDDDRQHVVAYLRQVQGRTPGEAKLSGDPRKGREVFVGKGRCSECHTVAGSGGFLGQDLTTFGVTRSADKVREAIVRPENAGSRYTIVTREGQTFSGVLRNEDNFSIQVQTSDGTFHLFEKAKLRRLTREGSVMPADYVTKLTTSELDDLISFLVTTGREAKALLPSEKKVYDEGADDDE
jgi:cytochrome c oxidase cbb3-type subunit III